jgi:histidinol-phosphate aminotransferase
VRAELRARGWAVRRGDTFPGLDAGHLRVAVRDPQTSRAFAGDLAEILGPPPPTSRTAPHALEEIR